MATFADEVTSIGMAWPEVEIGTSYGTPALKVKGKMFCRLWSDREYARDSIDGTEVLVIFCDIDEKDALIESSNGVLFSTPHYDGHGAMLIRLADAEPDDLRDYLEDSYRMKAPARVLKAMDAEQVPDGTD